MHAQLVRRGHRHGRKRVARIMRASGWRGRAAKRWKKTNIADPVSIKGELIDLQAWPTRAGARRAVVDYIGWYNGTRLHSSLGYLSPAEFEAATIKEAMQKVA